MEASRACLGAIALCCIRASGLHDGAGFQFTNWVEPDGGSGVTGIPVTTTLA